MPDDLPLAARRPVTTMADDEWDRHLGYWEVFYAVSFTVIAIMAWRIGGFSVTSRFVATAGMAGIVGWYLLWRNRFETLSVPAALVYRVGLAGFLCVAVISVDVTAYLLFPIVAQLYGVPPLRHTVATVIVINFAPVLSPVWHHAPAATVWEAVAVAVTTATASVVIGVLTYRIVYQSAERGDLIAQLEASRSEVARLSHEAGVRAERDRMAAEIHDTITQGLASLVMLTQSARSVTDPDERDAQLRLAERTSRSCLAESRELVAALTPDPVEPRLIDDSIAELASDADARFDVDGDPRPLAPHTAIVLLRAVKEALTNIGKHAAGADATVRVRYQDASVTATVTDTGPGFDPADPAAGFGLRGMRNRVTGIGGTCAVESVPGAGTVVTVSVPVTDVEVDA